jgi:hypothetical protein
MRRAAGPLIGVEYDVHDPDTLMPGRKTADSIVPIGYDDTGNCQVDVFSPDLDGKTMLWNPDALVEFEQQGIISEYKS